jgi:hypothetical protein
MKKFRRIGIIVLLGIATIGVIAFFFFRGGRSYQAPTVAFCGESSALRESEVVPTLDTPTSKGKNVVWCGTIQIGWNHFEKDILHAPPAIRGAKIIVTRLNQGILSEEDLPSDSFLATAGFIKDGIIKNVRDDMKERFQKDVQFDSMSEPNGILVYSYLQTHLAFTIPYFDNREAFLFQDSQGEKNNVTSFGIEEKDEYAYQQLRDQIDVLYRLQNENKLREPKEFILDLCKDSMPNQIVLACIPPRESLSETLYDCENKIREFAAKTPPEVLREYGPLVQFGPRDVLLVPNLNWEIRHHFTDLEGPDKPLENPGFENNYIQRAEQSITFKLDRSGAELSSEFKAYCKPSATHYKYNRPFLIYIKKRGQKSPFFVMWVDNAELLCKPQKNLNK